jgi:hypothetical protein
LIEQTGKKLKRLLGLDEFKIKGRAEAVSLKPTSWMTIPHVP